MTRLSDTRWKVKTGRKTYYARQISPASEDYDAFMDEKYQTLVVGTPAEWEVDDGTGPRRVTCGPGGPHHALVAFEAQATPVVVSNGTINASRFLGVGPALPKPPASGQGYASGPNGTIVAVPPKPPAASPANPRDLGTINLARRYVYDEAAKFVRANVERMKLDPVILDALTEAEHAVFDKAISDAFLGVNQ